MGPQLLAVALNANMASLEWRAGDVSHGRWTEGRVIGVFFWRWVALGSLFGA